MCDLYEADNAISFYRSTDPIKNLKIKVRLERITSAVCLPNQPNVNDNETDNNKNENWIPNMAGERDIEIFTFQWQQKVFSEEEYRFYSNEANCDTVLQNKYHKDCLQLEQDGGRKSKRLFTYISNDNYINNLKVEQVTNKHDEEETALAGKMRGIRHRRIAPVTKVNNKSTQALKSASLNSNIVNYDPTLDQKNRIHLLPMTTQNMFIMADLSIKTSKSDVVDEAVLCEINIDDRGILSIRPDFNEGKKSYQVEQKSCRDELDIEQKMYKELYSRHATYLSECVGREFLMPQANIMSYTIFGEIHSAVNFEYDDIYVTYYVDLPDGWHSKDINSLQGVTHACRSKSVNRDNICNFCYPFDISLEYNEKFVEEKQEYSQIIKYPNLFVEVKSLDMWGRCRLEGYGYIILPDHAGYYSYHSYCGFKTLNVNCWRPVGDSCTSQLRRFFVGGNPELEDTINACKPHYFKEKYLSKLGMLTESTGSVQLKLNVIKQSQKFIRDLSLRNTTSNESYDKLYDMNTNINSAIDAFQQAKQRMISARNNLHTEYIDTLQMMDIGKTD